MSPIDYDEHQAYGLWSLYGGCCSEAFKGAKMTFYDVMHTNSQNSKNNPICKQITDQKKSCSFSESGL